ncbi:Small nuclear ribonucleoprotein-associated protein B' [Zancudomyces culisetae]|uniref:Sm protein B n=1 Tax=Zancudomyces culisetae TaxID=1213189 RepID=A0A1R1PPH4_ZANCU|nr:Small nuclear ribonucleoprotein-associated protein B' [Zancudomyces culisetae]|eukprot:OMH82841.1 Small nuclear ribonucleoprotein-associated protein B' [Zancudomyces culisetae]
MNLVLADCEEFRQIKTKLENRQIKRILGLVVLRGENVISISVDGPPPVSVESIQARAAASSLQPGPGLARPTKRTVPLSNAPTAAAGPIPAGLSGPVRGIGGPVPGMMQPRPGIPSMPMMHPPVGFRPGMPPTGGAVPPPGFRPPIIPPGARPPMGIPGAPPPGYHPPPPGYAPHPPPHAHGYRPPNARPS